MSGEDRSMSEARQRDWPPILHIGVGMTLIVGLNSAHLFGLFDVGAISNLILILFTMQIFVLGQPRGRHAWLVAIWAVLLTILSAVAAVAVVRWMAGGDHSFDASGGFAAIVIGGIGLVKVREMSVPGPEHSPTNNKAWKPITRWGVVSGLGLGAIVFAAALFFWNRWVATHLEDAAVAMFIKLLQAFLASALAASTTIYCRPSDWRSTILSVLAGLAVAGLMEACVLGGMALGHVIAPGRTVLAPLPDTLIYSIVLVVPAAYAVTWALGRKPGGWVEPEGSAG